MFCTYQLTVASIKMFLRNRQAVFFSLFMPLIILFIFGSLDFDKPPSMRIGLVTHRPGPGASRLVQALRSAKTIPVEIGTLESELANLNGGGLNAVLDIPDDLLSPANSSDPKQLTVYVNSGRPFEGQMAMSFIKQFANQMFLAAAHVPTLFTINQKSVSAHNSRYIEFLLPGVIAMAIMQMCVFSVAFVFARYKEQGILKHLMATPMRPYQFVTANIITRLFMAVTQASIFVVLGAAIFHVTIAGSYWLIALCVVLGALMFLGLGFTVSGLSKNVETAPLLANIVVFPMLFVGNIFFSVSTMPGWLKSVSAYLPLTFFANGMRSVMTDGAGPAGIERDLIGMTVWSVLLIVLSTATFRFHERQG